MVVEIALNRGDKHIEPIWWDYYDLHEAAVQFRIADNFVLKVMVILDWPYSGGHMGLI